MTAYRYIVDSSPYTGGIVFAEDEIEAKAKVTRHYILTYGGYAPEDIQIWKYEDDDYYCSEVPDVYDCYGE